MNITFQLTYDCNLRCKYCYQHNKRAEKLDIKDIYLFLDKLFLYLTDKEENIFSTYIINKEEVLAEPFMIIFFGGEATLELVKIDLICDYFHKLCVENNLPDYWDKCKFRIDTNGTTYAHNPLLDELKEKYKGHLQFAFTIDGCKEAHDMNRVFVNGEGSFDKVVEGIEQYKKDFNTQVPPQNKITFSDATVPYMTKSIEVLWNLGYRYFLASYDEFHQCTKEETERFYEALVKTIDFLLEKDPNFIFTCVNDKEYIPGRRHSLCGSTGHAITLSPGGYITTCTTMTPSTIEGEDAALGILGDVRNGITNTALLDYMRHQIFLDPKQCKDCPIKRGCDGCAALNLHKTGYLFLDWHNCGSTIAEARAQLYLKKRIEELGLQEKVAYWDKIKDNAYDPDYDYLINSVFNKKDTK